jgi:hypothetical protein
LLRDSWGFLGPGFLKVGVGEGVQSGPCTLVVALSVSEIR